MALEGTDELLENTGEAVIASTFPLSSEIDNISMCLEKPSPLARIDIEARKVRKFIFAARIRCDLDILLV